MTLVDMRVDDGLGRLVLNHPPLNILSRAMLGEVRAALDALAADDTVRAVLISAGGKHFSAGADVGEHLPPDFRTMIPEFLETIAGLDAFPVPVIAAVQGRCLGGGFELVLGADIVIAADNARFGQPEIVLGVVPPAACALLPSRCPRGVAAALVYTGDPIDAAEAHRVGLVYRVVEAAALEAEAFALAHRITTHSGAALRVAKRSMRLSGERPEQALAAAGAIYMDDLMATHDAVEGLNAFLEKREPTWSHR